MSARRWMGIVASVAVWLPFEASAQLLEPPVPPAEAPAAKPAKPATVPQLTEEDRIARLVKTAERESFERHEIDRALAIYAPKASIVIGRREAPDEHDIRYDLAAKRAVLEARYSRPPASQEQIFFRDVEVVIDGESATMNTVVARELFSGREEMQHRYTLARRDGRWQVTAQRVWPIMRSQGGVVTTYTDEALLAAEEEAEKVMANPSSTPQSKLFALTGAGHLARAHAVTVAWTKASPEEAEAWIARHRFALEVGQIEDARKAWAKAASLGASDAARGAGVRRGR